MPGKTLPSRVRSNKRARGTAAGTTLAMMGLRATQLVSEAQEPLSAVAVGDGSGSVYITRDDVDRVMRRECFNLLPAGEQIVPGV